MRSPLCLPLAALAAASALAWATPARADISSWLFVGGGAMSSTEGGAERQMNGALSLDLGVGTSPDGSVIVGGLVRTTTLFDAGTDLAVLARGATWGFQAGRFGLALDAGAYARFWGAGSTGFTGALTLGAPLGFTLSVQGMVGSNQVNGIGAVAGLDLLRLTVYRQSLLDYWPNPAPGQEERQAARLPGRRYW